MVSLEVPSRDKSFQWMLNWLNERSQFRSQHVSVETKYTQHENGDVSAQLQYIPNVGDHFFQHNGRWFKVRRDLMNICFMVWQMQRVRERNVVDITSGALWESITLTTFGRDRYI